MSSPSHPNTRSAARRPRRVGRIALAKWMTWWLLLLGTAPTWAVDLQSVTSAASPGNLVEITLTFSGPVAKPTSFATESPARIALDFPDVINKLDHKVVPIGVGAVHSLIAVEASNRTRVVINLNESVPYEVSTNGNQVRLKINTQAVMASAPPPAPPPAGVPATPVTRGGPPMATPQAAAARAAAAGGAVRDIDFRRGNGGEGRVVIKLPSAQTRVAVREQAGHVFVDLYDSTLPPRLFRRLDVTDFATPVTAVESKASGRNVLLDIQTGAEYDYLAYQTDDLFTLEFRALTPGEKDQLEKKKATYTGDRLSLNFQDIEVRAVMQLLADFTGLNMIASDSVHGSITLRLKNVPWDQALEIILKSKGLGMRQTGNVIMIAPSQELAAQEKLELESNKQIAELAPLRSEFIQINYAKAEDLATMLKSVGGADGKGGQSLLSERGSVSVDKRTNTLLVQDTTTKLEDIRRLVARLDVPVRQVMIESRIVVANNDFARDLGVRFGATRWQQTANGSGAGTFNQVGGSQAGGAAGTGTMQPQVTVAGYNTQTNTIIAPNPNQNPTVPPTNPTYVTSAVGSVATPAALSAIPLLVNLPAATPSGAVNFLIGKVGSYLLQLELSAMQTEGRGEIISSPRVITSDSQEATIKMGQQIPYQSAAGGTSGGTTTSFADAMLQLKVKPQITPDDRVIMDLQVDNNSAGATITAGQPPPINTRSVKTTVLVDNGDTVILGGVYERTKNNQKEQVPWLGDIPMLGHLFKQQSRTDNNSELLIFVTPKIMKGDMVRK